MRIGILGLGYMGIIRERVLRERADVQIARIATGVPPQEGGDPRSDRTTHWQDVVDDPAIDAVVVCLPNDLLAAATLRALAAGKHVLCEKPPGVTLAEATRMRDAARASGRTLQFGFNLRYHGSIEQLTDLVRSGELGELRWLRGVYGKPTSPDFAEGWRADPARAGGGILLDQGIHLLDVMNELAGPFDEVQALAATHGDARVEDDVMAILRGRNGALASLHSSHGQSPPRFSLELGMTHGAARIEGLLTRTGRYGPERIVWGPATAPDAHARTFTVDASWSREMDAFFHAIASATPPAHGSGDQAVALMALLERIYLASGVRRGAR